MFMKKNNGLVEVDLPQVLDKTTVYRFIVDVKKLLYFL